MKERQIYIFALVLIGLIPTLISAQRLHSHLFASDLDDGEALGEVVAASGNFLLAGAPFDNNENGYAAGSAYMFYYDGQSWIEHSRLLPADGTADDFFAISVAINGDLAIISAPWKDEAEYGAGSVYVFRYDTLSGAWAEEAKLVAGDGDAGDHLGNALAIDQRFAFVAAESDDNTNGLSAGSVYVYENTGSSWIEMQKIFPIDGHQAQAFGFSLALADTFALIGATQDEGNGVNAGAVYVYHLLDSLWVEYDKLRPSDAGAHNFWGHSLAIDGSFAIIGAVQEFSQGPTTGAAYFFEYDGFNWTEHSKINASDAAGDDWFGNSVDIQASYALVGARGDDGSISDAGAAYLYVFDKVNWVEQTKIISPQDAGINFGNGVALADSFAIIGAPEGAINGIEPGALYVYDDLLVQKRLRLSVSIDSIWLPVPPGGASFPCNLIMANMTADTASTTMWLDLKPPGKAARRVLNPKNPRIQANTTTTKSTVIRVLGEGPPGEYNLTIYWIDDGDTCGYTTRFEKLDSTLNSTRLEATENVLPRQFELEQNYPNPFNPTTNFGFQISDFGYVTIHIYDVQGRLVRSLLSGQMTPGQYNARWNGTSDAGVPVASGVYLYRLTAGRLVQTRKMILLR